MTREELKALGLTDDQVEKVMTMKGKVVEAEQAKKGGKTDEDVKKAVDEALAKAQKESASAVDGLNKQIETLTKQKADLDKIIKDAPSVDDAVKKAIEEAEKAHATALADAQKAAEEQIQGLKRDSETADFLRSLGKEFVTPETETVFRNRLNEALQDKANEGKNRADIFASLSLGADGKERTDIFKAAGGAGGAAGAAGGQEALPGAGGAMFTGPVPVCI